MKKNNKQENRGTLLYREGSIETRINPNHTNSYNVWIGADLFFFGENDMDRFAQRTPFNRSADNLKSHSSLILSCLEREKVSPEEFILYLSRAKGIESERKYQGLRGRIEKLRDELGNVLG